MLTLIRSRYFSTLPLFSHHDSLIFPPVLTSSIIMTSEKVSSRRWLELSDGEDTNIRHKILYAFEVVEQIYDPVQRRASMTFENVGKGPDRLELTGAIARSSAKRFKNAFRSIHPEEAQIILLEGAARVLMLFQTATDEKATRSLGTLIVTVNCGAMIIHVAKVVLNHLNRETRGILSRQDGDLGRLHYGFSSRANSYTPSLQRQLTKPEESR